MADDLRGFLREEVDFGDGDENGDVEEDREDVEVEEPAESESETTVK